MPQPDDSSEDAFRRLDRRLDSLQAQRATPSGERAAISTGYRLVGEVIGGVLGGLGLGVTLDHFAHTQPWGVIGGLLIGAVFSVSAASATAARTADRLRAEADAPKAQAADDEED